MNKKKFALMQSVIALLLCISMLVSTTFAWFTDSVQTGINTIASGVLDVELFHSNAAAQDEKVDSTTELFKDLNGKDILWEPGVVSYENLRITNAGDLALAYQLSIVTANENFVLDADNNPLYGLSQILKVGFVEGGITATDRDGVVASVEDANWTSLASFLQGGSLMPANAAEGDSEQVWGIVIYWQPGDNDNFWNLNNGKKLDQGDVLSIDLGVKLVATQEVYEADSFGNDYDTDAKADVFPDFVGGSASAPVVPDDQNQTTQAVTLTSGAVSAYVPAGVLLAEGALQVEMNISNLSSSDANIVLDKGEEMRSLDVHIGGVSAENTLPITVTLREAAPVGLNMGNYKLYHVENGATNEMTLVASDADFTAHNQFKYDPATGDITLYMATFSEVALVADTENAWNGEFDYSWYVDKESPYVIASADQLAAFGAIVGGMNDQTQDSFSGKTIKLISDINLGDKNNASADLIFHPIGYYYTDDKNADGTTGDYYSTVNSFEGTFDGQGHTIGNFYQNTWEIKGDYDGNYYKDAMGLFGYVYGGTVKNLTVDHFSSDGEFTPTGVIAAYAAGDAKFENIAITNCNPRVYNTGNGGIIGIAGSTGTDDDSDITLKNITVDNTNKISALWGSWDVACGGLVGMYRGNVDGSGNATDDTISFENCHVAAQIDVYNDVCANYQYYAYRYAGMIIGSVRHNKTTTVDGATKTIPNMTGISATGCTVNYGDWNDYYYCEFVKNSPASYSEDYQFSRVPHSELNFTDSNRNGVVDADERASVTGCKHTHTAEENHQAVYLPFHQLFTGYSWGVSSIGLEEYSGITVEEFGLDIEEGTQQESVEKFAVKNPIPEIANGNEIKVGDLFEAIEGAVIKKDNVQVYVSPIGTDSTVEVEYTANTEDWTKGTLKFTGSGSAEVIITDYNFCKETKLTVSIATSDKYRALFDTDSETAGVQTPFLYRVGNLNTVTVSSLFAALNDEVTINSENVAITVASVDGSSASGEYTADTSNWLNGTIQFEETGLVKVTVGGDSGTAIDLYLEVVEAKNITTATGSNGTDVVLLSDVEISTNGTAHYENCTVFGNGFTFDVSGGMNQYNSKQGHGIIIAKNATLDHLRVVGDVYEEYGMYTTCDLAGTLSNDYTGAIDATNCIIQNCYIANCATPIRSNGNTITDTTLYGGTVANLLISGGTNTLTNVTTINYNDGRGVIGMGIVITDGASADTTKLILEGYLKQYNYVYETDVDTIQIDAAKTVLNSMFDGQFSDYHIGADPKAVNTGIISINDSIDLVSTVFTDNAETGYSINNDVSITVSAQGLSKTIYAAVASTPGSSNVDNNYVDEGNAQGDYLPTFTFELGNQMLAKDDEDDTRYLIGDENGLQAMYPEGEDALTLDLTTLATVTKYTNVSYPVTAKCVGPDGTEQTGTITLATKGTYTLVFTVDDNVFYDQNGNLIEKSVKRTYEVTLVLDVYEKSVADATMTISNSALTGEYVSAGTSYYYQFYPLRAIVSIMDDANKDGTLETFDFKSNIANATISSVGDNAFSGATTIVVTYNGGQVLTIVLGVPNNLSSPSTTNGGKTLSVTIDSTNGIYVKSDGHTSAKDGTWPITSWAFKGTSTKNITDSTQVKINFEKPSCITGDTLVTLADGSQKRIDEVTYADELLAWDFFKGEYTAVSPAIIFDHGVGNNTVIELNFSDGTTVKVVNLHQFFDADLNEYVSIDAQTVSDYVGHKFVKKSGDSYGEVALVDYNISQEYVEAWGIISAMHYNIIVEGMLSTDFMLEDYDLFNYFEVGDNMMFDEAKMQADIEKYGLYTYADFADYLTYEQFMAFNVPYFKVAVGKGNYTYEGILALIDTYLND